jgi:hypothetical protein
MLESDIVASLCVTNADVGNVSCRERRQVEFCKMEHFTVEIVGGRAGAPIS